MSVASMGTWLVRLSVRSDADDRLPTAIMTYLTSELDHLRIQIESSDGPTIVQVAVSAHDSTEACDYAKSRVGHALRSVGVTNTRCELLDVSVDLRSS